MCYTRSRTNPAAHALMEVLIQTVATPLATLAAYMKLRCHQCYWLLLLFPCLCTAPLESDEFSFFLEGADACLGVHDHSLILSSSCEEASQRWKWVTRGRLFNLGSSLCLGVTTGNYTSRWDKSPLGVYTCDREPPRIRWTWNCAQVLENFNSYIPLASFSNSSVAPPTTKFKWRLYGNVPDLCSKIYQGRYSWI